MRIPTDRLAALLRLLYHQPDGRERELLDALANASEHSRDEAFMDRTSASSGRTWRSSLLRTRAGVAAGPQEMRDRAGWRSLVIDRHRSAGWGGWRCGGRRQPGLASAWRARGQMPLGTGRGHAAGSGLPRPDACAGGRGAVLAAA